MSVDLTDLFEDLTAPPMHVDLDVVLARGRRRRLRRRLARGAGLLGAAALVVPAALVLRMDAALAPAPATSPWGDCLFTDPKPGDPPVNATHGARLAGQPWLDTGPEAAGRSVRVQVHTDTCAGLAVAVSKGAGQQVGGSVATADLQGRPEQAFWVLDATGGGLDRSGAVVPATPSAVVLLPDGQSVCGLATGPDLSDLSRPTVPLTDPVTVPARSGWQAVFATLPAVATPDTAALRICDGDRVIAAALRPLDAVVPTTATVDEATGAIVLPLDSYWPSQLESADLASAQRVAMIRCKASKGVTSIDEVRRVISDAPMHRFGVWRLADAERYGYLEPMSDEKLAALADNADPSQGPSQAEIDAAHECVREDPMVKVLNEQPATGPWEKAVAAADEAAQQSRAWDDAVDDWARCLEDQGVGVDRESLIPDGVDARALDERRVRPEDVALAVTDVTCKRQEDTIQRLANIVAAAQAPVIEQHKARFLEQRAALDKQLVLARQVLADAGL